MATYRETLASPRWRRLKWRRLMVARFSCERCGWKFHGRGPKMALHRFELHHVTYARVGEENLEDVRILCPECHAITHGHL